MCWWHSLGNCSPGALGIYSSALGKGGPWRGAFEGHWILDTAEGNEARKSLLWFTLWEWHNLGNKCETYLGKIQKKKTLKDTEKRTGFQFSISVVLKRRPLNQQQQHHLGISQKWKFSGPTLDEPKEKLKNGALQTVLTSPLGFCCTIKSENHCPTRHPYMALSTYKTKQFSTGLNFRTISSW